MPIIFGTGSRDPDVWRCDFLNFDPDEQCNAQEFITSQRTPKGWYESELGEVFCPEHASNEIPRWEREEDEEEI